MKEIQAFELGGKTQYSSDCPYAHWIAWLTKAPEAAASCSLLVSQMKSGESTVYKTDIMLGPNLGDGVDPYRVFEPVERCVAIQELTVTNNNNPAILERRSGESYVPQKQDKGKQADSQIIRYTPQQSIK